MLTLDTPGQHKVVSDDISMETSVLVANVIPIGRVPSIVEKLHDPTANLTKIAGVIHVT